jgi:Flp pilus assembly protein CpaB
MTVPGTADQLLAGIVQPGDHVDVVANIKLPNSDVHYTRVIVHDALVLRAPAAPSSGNAATGQLIATLQLSDAEAQRLYWAQENGNFALVLRPSTHPQGGSLKPQSAQTLLQKGV